MSESGQTDKSIWTRNVSRRGLIKGAGVAVGSITALGIPAGIRFLQSVGEEQKEADLTKKLEVLKDSPIRYGFNTHMRAEPGPGENLTLERFKSDVDLLASKNQKWVRFNLMSEEVTNAGTTASVDWNEDNLAVYDEAVNYAKAQGLQVFLVTNVPDFAKDFSLEDYKNVAEQFYTHLAERYAGKIDVWQIFNEPNVHHYRDYRQINTMSEEYLRELSEIVKLASGAIKSADPTSRTTVNFSRWVGNQSKSAELFGQGVKMYDLIAADIDCITLDCYPDQDASEIARLPTYVERISSNYSKPVIIGELGLPTTGTQSAADQGNYTSQAIHSLVGGPRKPEAIILYELRDETTTGNPTENSFGFLNKPSFNTVLHAMADASNRIKSRDSVK